MLALAASLAWSLLGWPFARRCLPRAFPAACLAPLLGWALHTALSAALLPMLGFSRGAIMAVLAGSIAAAWAWHRRAPRPGSQPVAPMLVLLGAVLALLPMAAVLPKHLGGGIELSAPIFDHSKIAIVSAIARAGLPAQNPFYGGPAADGGLAYYYWWHLSAAELARLSGASAWTADAALTWFTAFASLLLIGGIGHALAPRAAMPAMALAIPASLRPLTAPLEQAGWLLPGTGLGGWLNQASWAPQHLAAASAVIAGVLVLATPSARRLDAPSLILLASLLAAGFGSSAWVGGIACAAAMPLALMAIAARLPAADRPWLLAQAITAAAGAVALALPLIRTELAASHQRAGLISLVPYPIFPGGTALADLAGFPLLLLIEFPVAATLGIWGARRAFARHQPPWQPALACTALAGLAVCWLLRSTIDNNDLGWRAMLLPVLIALPFAGQAWLHAARGAAGRAWPGKGRALRVLPLLGLLGTTPLLRQILSAPAQPGIVFAGRAALWQAVRRIVPPEARIASDPRMDGAMTPWDANIGWALLADRASCYAGWATVHPFVPVSSAELYTLHQRLLRVFDGVPAAGDLAVLTALRCDYALVTTDSPAWQHDPFARADIPVAGAGPGWRLYRVR